jgi:hypothetical protein
MGARAVAAKQRDPTAAGHKQIQSKFRKIFAGKLEFITIKNMQTWYGRYDNKAVEKLEAAWKEYWGATDWNPGRAPKLFAAGPTTSPKGYAICRADKKKNWLY